MLEEIQVLADSGVPLYYFSQNQADAEDTTQYLKASFFAAVANFASELQNGEVRLVLMDRRKFLVNRARNLLIIFETDPESPGFEEGLAAFSAFLDEFMNRYGNPTELQNWQLAEINAFLEKEGLIPEQSKSNIESMRQRLENSLFRTVGYVPGQCNIGRRERLQRLTFGLVWLLLSLVITVLLLEFSLPPELALILIVPNFLGFLGVLQYFYRFCTTNAIKGKFTMR